LRYIFDLRIHQLGVVHKLNISFTVAVEGVDESADLRLGVAVCLQPPALDDLGHGVDQTFDGGMVVEAEEHDDLGDGFRYGSVDVEPVRLQLFFNVDFACVQLLKS
jgi:hypothetical protein